MQDMGFACVTWAVEPVSRESLLARTAIWAHGVVTVGIVAAHVCPIGALIQVWNTAMYKSNHMHAGNKASSFQYFPYC